MITTGLTRKPRQVLVCGHVVKIRCRQKIRGGHLGYFDADANEIYIANDAKWKEHLLHEILHAVLFYSGQSERMKENEEESLVRAIENGLKTLGFT